jgi:hypothetical protein
VEYLGHCALIKPMAAATPVVLMPFKLLHSGIMRYDDSLEGQLGDLMFYPDSTEVSISSFGIRDRQFPDGKAYDCIDLDFFLPLFFKL